MKKGIVDVLVIIFPDGMTHFFESSQGKEYIYHCVEIWKEKNKQKYEGHEDDTMLAVANIKMFQSDFDKIGATDYFIETP